MIAVDTNILVYAHRRDTDWHQAAAACVEELAESARTWVIPWPCIHEFLAIVTHPRIYRPPSTLQEACGQVEAWSESPSLQILGEGVGHWPQLQKIIVSAQVTGPKIHDARVAAICQSHGVSELWTADRDFSRFGQLNVRNPLL